MKKKIELLIGVACQICSSWGGNSAFISTPPDLEAFAFFRSEKKIRYASGAPAF